jgi:hypothetical protein
VRKSLSLAVPLVMALSVCIAAGTALYRWLNDGDKVTCIANEFTFGCGSILGWVLSALGVLVLIGLVLFWERYRGD